MNINENGPSSPEMTIDQIKARLAEIDHEHFTLTESLDRAPSEFQESTQLDDDASEGEAWEQKRALISDKLKHLNEERDRLHKQLDSMEKAA